MKMNIKHFDAINRHCPNAIDILRRYYNPEERQIQITSNEIDSSDLNDAHRHLAQCMETLLNKAEQEDRGFNTDEVEAWEALRDWCTRFEEKYNLDKPSNPLPPITVTYEKDDMGNPSRPALNAKGTMRKDDPLTREQRMEDWYTQFRHKGERLDLSVGDYVRAWITGEQTEQTQRAMSTTGSGGVLIPQLLSAKIIDLARNKTRVIQAGAMTWPMESKTLTVPKQTGDPTAGWRPELGHIHRTEVSFEPLILKACSMGALVTLSSELVEDAVGLTAFLNRVLAQVMAETIDQAALSGAGTIDPETEERIEPVGVLNTDKVQDIKLNDDLTSYVPFSSAVTKIRQVNGEPSGLMMAPSNFGILDALTDTTGQPLQPPPSWRQVSHYDTNQVDGQTAIVGDWSQLAIGLRHSLRLEYATAGTIPQDKEGIYEELNLFSQNAIAIRVLWRGDVAVQRPDQFVVIKNIGVKPGRRRNEKES